jgi:hypothetical protein
MNNKYHITPILGIIVVAAIIMGAPLAAVAQNPHFVQGTFTKQGNNLVCSFKEAGLGSGQSVIIECTASATAVYQCVNRGGNNPQAENKRTVTSQVSESGQFQATKSGQVTGSLTVEPPSAGSFTCPGGQTLTLVSVTYTNVQIRDLTTGAQITPTQR